MNSKENGTNETSGMLKLYDELSQRCSALEQTSREVLSACAKLTTQLAELSSMQGRPSELQRLAQQVDQLGLRFSKVEKTQSTILANHSQLSTSLNVLSEVLGSGEKR